MLVVYFTYFLNLFSLKQSENFFLWYNNEISTCEMRSSTTFYNAKKKNILLLTYIDYRYIYRLRPVFYITESSFH